MVFYVSSQTFPISIHALREEDDCQTRIPTISTSYFYPRPPRGGRHVDFLGFLRRVCISIHALREEDDAEGRPQQGGEQRISIHALREEGDPSPF